MKVYKEIELRDFEAWSGAVYTMDTLKDLEEQTNKDVFDTLEVCLDEMGEGMSETEINDFLWFENEVIADWLGYSSWEELEQAAMPIEIKFYIGDVVAYTEHGKTHKSVIIEIDEEDKDLPYLVEYGEDGYSEWARVDEVKEWTEDAENGEEE